MPLLQEMTHSLLAPQQNACHLCGALLRQSETCLCSPCRQALSHCRIPAPEAADADCPPLSIVLAAFWYEREAKALVHQLKFGHDLVAACPLADGLCAAYADRPAFLPRPDVVVAVPSHSSRLRARGYSQAEVIAKAFCACTRLPFAPDALVRLSHSTSQVSRSWKERLAAMTGAFEARRSFADMSVLLIDDVSTTGATGISCGESLVAAGARRVDLLVCCKA